MRQWRANGKKSNGASCAIDFFLSAICHWRTRFTGVFNGAIQVIAVAQSISLAQIPKKSAFCANGAPMKSGHWRKPNHRCTSAGRPAVILASCGA
jgi:hypothetical protein